MPRKPRYSEQQIIRCIKEVEAGAVSIDEMARRIGVHPRTLEKWRTKYEGMNGSDATLRNWFCAAFPILTGALPRYPSQCVSSTSVKFLRPSVPYMIWSGPPSP